MTELDEDDLLPPEAFEMGQIPEAFEMGQIAEQPVIEPG